MSLTNTRTTIRLSLVPRAGVTVEITNGNLALKAEHAEESMALALLAEAIQTLQDDYFQAKNEYAARLQDKRTRV